MKSAALLQGALPPAKLFRLQLSVHGGMHELAYLLLEDVVASFLVAGREIRTSWSG